MCGQPLADRRQASPTAAYPPGGCSGAGPGGLRTAQSSSADVGRGASLEQAEVVRLNLAVCWEWGVWGGSLWRNLMLVFSWD